MGGGEGGEGVAERGELPRRGGGSVDVPRAALADLALQDHRLEDRFDACAVGAVPDLVGAPARTQRQAERVDDERLAAAGLAGEQVQARTEPDVRLGDQGE